MSIFGGNKGKQQQNSSANPSSDSQYVPASDSSNADSSRGAEQQEQREQRHGMNDTDLGDMINGE